MRILYIDIDTLRPDHLGCYGYHRDTSPNIDHIASEGVRFENYYSSDAPCLPARASLVSGQFGIHTGVINHGGLCADMRPQGADRGFVDRLRNGSLWGALWRHNIHTASISTFAGRHAAWWFNAGMNEVHDIGYGGGESGEQITPIALDWIDRNAAQDNWLLHVHYWDPHTPYRAPAEFGNPFKDEPLPEWLTEETVAGFKDVVGGHGPWDVAMFDDTENPKYPRQPGRAIDMAGVRKLIDGYDCGVAYADQQVGKLLDALEQQGALSDTAIIVSSDHGEDLGELGCCAEHGLADHITCRVPMIIRWPDKAPAGHVDTGLHYNLDLAPTLVEMLDLPASARAEHWDGTSYAAALRGEQAAAQEYLVLSQCCHGCQRSVRWDDWLYIRTYHDFYHLYPREMLFNLKDDPHEQHDLADERPDLCQHAAHLYLDWHDQMMASSRYDADPLWTVLREGGPFHSRGKLARYCERLAATGRGWAIEPLKERHPGEVGQ